jgi:hypothetical protein
MTEKEEEEEEEEIKLLHAKVINQDGKMKLCVC